jgi:ABC-2 type transport system permease protein
MRILYDFGRTITSKSVITVMLLPIAISLAIIPLAVPAPAPPINTNNTLALLYFDNNGYHILLYSGNQYGQPISGVSAQFGLTDSVHNYGASGTTNSSGYSSMMINAPISNNYTASWSITSPENGFSFQANGIHLVVPSPNGQPQNLTFGQIMPLIGPTISTVTDSSNASKNDVQVFYAGPDGAKPNYEFYYKVHNASSSNGPSLATPAFNESQMQPLGSLSDYHQIYVLKNIPENSACLSQSNAPGSNGFAGPVNCDIEVDFALFSQNGTRLQSTQISVYALEPPPPPPIQPNSVAGQFFQTIMGLFIPLIAIVGSYSSYGKDRVTGVLESVLARPITRRGLGISRYLSAFLALAVSVVISVAFVDLILGVYSGGSLIGTTYLLTAVGTFLVEVAAFVGLMFLFSHLVESTGLLIGIGIAMFVVLDLFWNAIVFGLTRALGATPGSETYLQVYVFSDFFNPTQLISLAYGYLTNHLQGVAIEPSTYGITVATLVLVAVLWIVVPFSLYIYRAIKKD